MTDLSESYRPGLVGRSTMTRWQRHTAGLCAAGGGAAFMGLLLLAPLARADGLPAPGGAAATDPGTQAAESFLYTQWSWDPTEMADGQETAYGAVSAIGQDGPTTFANLYINEMDFITDAFTDYGVVSSSVEGAIGDVGSLLSGVASVAGAAAAVGPYSDTVSGLISAISTETGSIYDAAHNILTQYSSLPPGAYGGELAVVHDVQQFALAIKDSVENLPTDTYNNNSTLMSYLAGVLAGEEQMYNEYMANWPDAIAYGSAAEMVHDNAWIYDYADNVYNYMQDVVSEFSSLSFWSSLGF